MACFFKMTFPSAFVTPSALPLRRSKARDGQVSRRKRHIQKPRQTRCQIGADSSGEPKERHDTAESSSQLPSEPVYGRFDAESDTDAFGRDPKKETDFWKDHAKSVLESPEVKEAIKEHTKDGGDGLTDEQRAHMEFIKQLDEGKHADEGSGKQ